MKKILQYKNPNVQYIAASAFGFKIVNFSTIFLTVHNSTGQNSVSSNTYVFIRSLWDLAFQHKYISHIHGIGKNIMVRFCLQQLTKYAMH